MPSGTACVLLGIETLAQPATSLLHLIPVLGYVLGSERAAEAERRARIDLQHALREEESVQARLAILTEASDVLVASLDARDTLRALAQLTVPALADYCVTFVVDGDSAPQIVDCAHVVPERSETLAALAVAHLETYGERSPLYGVLRTGESWTAQNVPGDSLATASDDELSSRLRRVGTTSWAIVPMQARQVILGAVALGSSGAREPFSMDDVLLVEDLARRAAVAVDNARLFEQTENALHQRDEFLSIASHELNTPLTALQLQVQLLRRYTARTSTGDDRVAAMAEGIERHSRRLTRLIRDLLDVSRIGAGRLELDARKVDLEEIARDVVERHQSESHTVGSTLSFESTGPVIGRWDRLRLDQVLTNLVSNACKYGAGKPIAVRVSTEGDLARLDVQDHGIGIDEYNAVRIFDRFERVLADDSPSGLGLGLYIVRQIVEAHGGSIDVRSRVGEGSTFTVQLPISGPRE